MKALIISDIHSNIYSLEAIWEKEKDSDIIYCAGDLVEYGPYPREVIEWIQEHEVICVKGNHDENIISAYREGINISSVPKNERTWAHHHASLLNEKEIHFLDSLPEYVEFTLDGINYCMKHRFNKSYDTINNIYQFRHFWKQHAEEGNDLKSEKRIVFGHTHYQAIHYLSNHELWLNPGSTSYRPNRQNDDLSQDAQYLTIVDGQIQIKQIKYDLTPLFIALEDVDLTDSQLKTAYRFFKPSL